MNTATTRSMRSLWFGVFVAFVVPVSCWVLAVLVDHGIAPYDTVRPLLNTLGTIAWSEVVLGPLGIVIFGRAMGVHGALTWIALMLLAIPVLAIFWFLCIATLSGALGNPF